MRTQSGSAAGFTLVEIMIVVAVIGLLLGIAVPSWVKTRTTAQTKVCIEQLFQIESAKQQWGVEVGKGDGDVPDDADLFGPTLYMKVRPVCPAGGDYELMAIGQTATCTITGHVLDN
jgi:prepilin-type N-terminal cleavage/methylation domain-containing protein